MAPGGQAMISGSSWSSIAVMRSLMASFFFQALSLSAESLASWGVQANNIAVGVQEATKEK
jgi:hypothetical protein